MEKWIQFLLQRKVLVYLLTCLIVLGGFISLYTFNVSLLPKSNLPYIHVSISGGSLPPEEMEEKITKPLESELKALDGIREYSSTTSTGRVRVRLLAEGGKGAEVKQEIENLINRLRNSFPAEVDHAEVIQDSLGEEYLMGLALVGDHLQTMHTLAEQSIKERIEAVPGVKKVEIDDSNVNNKIQLTLLPDRLVAYQLTPQNVIDQLRASNWRQALGKLENEGFNTVVEVDHRVTSIEQLRTLLVQTPRGAVQLGQLAEIADLRGHHDQALFTYQGNHFVTLHVYRTDSSHLIKTQQEVQQVIEQINLEADGHYQLNTIQEAASFVHHAVSNLSRDVMLGGLLAVLILFFFLKNYRVTLVIATTIPLSVFMTFIAMKVAGYDIDLVTLISLSLAVGLMVDAAIVVLESIYQHREQGETLTRAIQLGAKDVVTPVMASQLTIIVVFLPLMFVNLGGEELQEIFFTVAFIVTVAIVASTIAAFLFVPVYASSFLAKDKTVSADSNKAASKAAMWLTRMLSTALRHRLKTILASLLLFASIFVLVPYMKMGSIGNINENYIYAELIMPSGSNLQDTQQALLAADKSLRELADVEDIYLEAYEQRGVLNILIAGKTARELPKDEIMVELNQRLNSLAEVERVQLGWGSGADAPIALDITGSDLTQLKELSDQAVDMLSTIPGVQNPRSQFSEGEEKMSLRLNQELMEQLQVDPQMLLHQLHGFLTEQKVATIELEGVEVDVAARYPQSWMKHPDQLQQILIPTNSGQMVPLTSLVEVRYSKSPLSLYHQDGERVIYVSAELAGSDLGTVNRQIKEKLAELPVPSGYNILIAGELKKQSENVSNGLLVFLASLAFIYLIMVAQFGKLSHPFIIMLTIPLALVGVVVGLVVTQREMTEMAMIGVIMLVGIVVSNAILLIDRINILRQRGYGMQEAILEAARNRVRPIIMTKLTAILGMLPLALAYAEGSELEAPLATVIIFGLVFHTAVTLVLVPVLYSLFEEATGWLKQRLLSWKGKVVTKETKQRELATTE